MANRAEHEKDFDLKARIRAVLWAQGYSTRVDVLLAFDQESQERPRPGGTGLTDLDVLGMRLDPGFRVHRVIADCKTSPGRVLERLFWLTGVARFFGADTALLVRSHPVPDHAPALARHLDVGIVGVSDMSILFNTYLNNSPTYSQPVWERFFSPGVLDDALTRLSRLPLQSVERYRKAGFWMDPPHLRLQRLLTSLQQTAKTRDRGPTFQLIFADFVWLYVFALWEACEALVSTGASRLEDGLQTYLTGDEAGRLAIRRMQRTFEQLAKRLQITVPITIRPPYFDPLSELLVRLLRRPDATAKMARRAEWLVIAQLVGQLGPPPWPPNDDDILAEKLLGDVAAFLVRTAGLDASYLTFYRSLLYFGAEPAQLPLGGPDTPRRAVSESTSQRGSPAPPASQGARSNAVQAPVMPETNSPEAAERSDTQQLL